MNIEEYISSGIIETYVMGAATAEEEKELLRLAREFPQIQAEIEAAREAMESYALLHSKIPPLSVKEKLFTRLSEQGEPVTSRPTPTANKAMRSIGQGTYFKTMAIAASVLLAASAALNLYLYNDLDRTREQLSEMSNRNKSLAEENNIQKADYQSVVRDLNIIRNPATKMVKMSNPDPAVQSAAVVYWDTLSKQTYLSLDNLPELPKGKQYQLWAFVGGQPLDMGLFDLKKGVLLPGKKAEKAEKFAVTLEDAGNGPVPKGTLVVIGSAQI